MTGSPRRLVAPLPNDAAPGLYLHIPFCRYVCPYCDFNVYARQNDLIPAYLRALSGELELLADAMGSASGVATVFIGGGTPSLLKAGQIEQILQAIEGSLGIAEGAEISVESNPDNLSAEYCADLHSIGIRRLSIGVQSLQQPGLKVLGRLHGADGARKAYEAARAAGFENISVDLIYGWPGQSFAQLIGDIDTVVAWDVDHISFYALIVEQGTPLSTAVHRGQLRPVGDDDTASYYDEIVRRLETAGFEHYEISNWARDESFRSLHNQIYWQNGRYFGVGAGAHSYLGNVRASNIRLPRDYIEAVERGVLPIDQQETINPDLEMAETMILGLRLLVDGVSGTDFATRHGVEIDSRYKEVIERLVSMGLLLREGDRIRLSASGVMVSNSVLAEFLP